MSDPSWQRIKNIFNEALQCPPAERAAFLALHCSDEHVRTEVLSLLSFYEEDPGFLESSVETETLEVIEAESRRQFEGQSIGPYQLDRELGRGGMGMVYLAHRMDGQFEHKVAIKFGKQDEFNEEIRVRLKHERQVLATLQHPNIARLLDGGVTDAGRPYFAMEYVEDGVSIDVFCDEQEVSLKKRLTLFQEACEAVAYAHRQLVVHRDLKPSNILVSPDGMVKLLDFGIAKLLDERLQNNAPVTRTGLRILTPEYASPEQVQGGVISTASDVYSLGVVLYELLVGRRPYAVHDLSPTQVERVVCEVDPVKPSAAIQETLTGIGKINKVRSRISQIPPLRLYRQIHGDLDNIVMKALRKEPERRYGSVEQLKEDISRYLDQLPISARPATVRYRVAKFVKRHRVGVSAILLVVLALLGGIISTSYQAARALRASEEADRRTQNVRAMANTLLFDIHDAIRDLPGATPARRLLVKNAEQYLDLLAQDLPEDPSLKLELAEAYNKVGELEGDPHFPNLGDLASASTYYQKALQLRTALWEDDSSNIKTKRALAIAQGRLAVVSSWGGANEEAVTLSKRALALLDPIYEADPDPDIRHDLGRMRSELGWWYVFAGEMEEAKLHLQQARKELEDVAVTKAGQVDFEIDLWRVYNYQVDANRWGDNPELALEILEDIACPRLERLNETIAFNPRLQLSYRTCLNKLGDLNKNLKHYDKAIGYFESSLQIATTIAASDSTNTLGKKGISILLEALGAVHKEVGNTDKALQYYDEALTLKQELYNIDPSNGEMGNTLGNTLKSLCVFYHEDGQPGSALGLCRQSVDVFEKAISVDPMNGIWRSNLVESYFALAHVNDAVGNAAQSSSQGVISYKESVKWYDKGINLIQLLDSEGRSFKWPALLDSIQTARDIVAAKVEEKQ